MHVVIVDGVMGAGKTLCMSILAKRWQAMTGCTLYSNYGLTGSKELTKFSDFIDVARQPSSIVCLDESHMDLSSRDFNANSVKFFTNLVFYLRKLRCTLFLTSPLFENIDSRVRQVTDIWVHAKKTNSHFIYDFYDVQNSHYIKSKKLEREVVSKIATGIYDTYAMVTPLEYPQKRDEYNLIFEDLKKEHYMYLTKNGVASR